MPEDPKAPDWKHDQKLNFGGVQELLVVVKDRIEDLLAAKKKELADLIGARDSLKPRK
jgi:hypothetical protein